MEERDSSSKRRKRRRKGISIKEAIFLLILIALLIFSKPIINIVTEIFSL